MSAPSHRPSRASSATVTTVILAAGYLVTLSANLPGQLSWDSVYALYQVRHHIPLAFDPPIENIVLHFFDSILPGPALFVTFDVFVFFLSLYVLLKLRERPSWWAPLAAVLIVASPLVLVTQATVWHDVLFANLSVAGFTAFAYAAKHWSRPTRRNTSLALAALLVAASALTRQNGLICVAVLCCGGFWIGWRAESRRAVRTGTGIAAGCIALLFAMSFAISLRNANASYGSGLEALQEFDIAGVAAVDPRVDLGILDHGDPKIEAMIRSEATKYSPQRISLVAVNTPKLWALLEAQTPAVISRQWWSILRNDPAGYIRHRIAVFDWTFLTPEIGKCLPVYVGIGGKPEWVRELGLPFGVRAQDRALFAYSSRFFTTPVYSHAFYALIALILLVLLVLRGELVDLAVATMLIAALLVTASYFIISLSCDFRFLYFLDIAAMAATLYAAADPPVGRLKAALEKLESNIIPVEKPPPSGV